MRNEQKLVEMLHTAHDATCAVIQAYERSTVGSVAVEQAESAAWSALFYHLTGRLPTSVELNTIITQE